ncbi:MAG: TPM domain-containing protein [Leptothrix sp. (in: b-proteobacteria)]
MVQRNLRLWWRHLWLDRGDTERLLGAGAIGRLQAGVTSSERRHSGQIRICVEAALPWRYLRGGASARDRAIAMFSKLRVWDTEHNNGVLIYLLLADQAVEIVADRGLNQHVGPEHWQRILNDMRQAFRQGTFEQGLSAAIATVDELLCQHFPVTPTQPAGPNELPDRPVLR